MKNQNYLISVLQIFAIILVVIGHSFYEAENLMVKDWIYTFHMPLFMLISGFLLQYTMQLKDQFSSPITLHQYGGFFAGKAKRLLIPYLVFSTTVYALKLFMSSYTHHPVDGAFSSYAHMLLYPWDNVIIQLWFLPTLFLVFFVVYSLLSIVINSGLKLNSETQKKYSLGIELVLLMAFLLLHLLDVCSTVRFLNMSGVIYYLIYFYAGFLLSKYDAVNQLEKHKYWNFAISFLLSIVLMLLPKFRGLDVVMAFNGIWMSISLGQIYLAREWKFLHPYFGSSYAIYLFSYFPLMFCQPILVEYAHIPLWLSHILAAVTGFYLPYVLYLIIKKYKNTKVGAVVALLTGQ